MFIGDGQDRVRSLFVRSHGDQRHVIVGHFKQRARSRVYRCRDVGKNPFDGCFYLVDIDVAYNDDRLQVGAVPFVIIIAQFIRFEIVDHVDCADRHPVGITAVRIDFRKLLFPYAGLCVLACAPFLADHAAFLVDRRIGKRDEARPVMQDQQAGIDYAFACHRGIHDHINRFVETGIGIEIFTHTHADALGKIVHSFVRKVFRAVEGHMFQEVCQSALILFFQHGAYVLGDIKVSPFFRLFIMTDVIG